MTKKTILLIALTLMCLNIFAQEVKPCLFIGRYDKIKRGIICSDRAYVQKGVNDIVEYEQIKKQFREEHKMDNPSTDFVSSKQCVIVYEFQQKISGWDCNPLAYNLKTGLTIESCEKELVAYVAKYPKEFKTQPKIIFTWQGKGETQKQTITEDFGGVAGKFYLVDKPNEGALVVAQLSNKTTDKLATILLQTADGKMIVEYLNPGETLTKKYDTKKLEIQVIYQDSKTPKPELNVIKFVKDQARKQVTNENGKLKSTKIGSIGVRG